VIALMGLSMAATIQLKLDGVVADGMPLRVAVFNSEESWLEEGGTERVFTVAAGTDTVTLDLGELPAGRWAVSVHHDQDDDGEIDFGWLPPGPTEGTSASCSSRPLTVPSWKGCSFEVTDQDAVLTMEMWY
jgi:uncharacterized protein (DUF2141 family)